MLRWRNPKAEALTAGHEPREANAETLGGLFGWGAVVVAGVLAGLAFVAIEMLFAWLALGRPPGKGTHAAVAAALAGDGPAKIAAVTLAFLVPLVLAACYGAFVAAVARPLSSLAAWWTGAISGLMVYVVNFSYLLAPALHWIDEARDQVSILSPWYSVPLWQ
jgi:hypothetical protein